MFFDLLSFKGNSSHSSIIYILCFHVPNPIQQNTPRLEEIIKCRILLHSFCSSPVSMTVVVTSAGSIKSYKMNAFIVHHWYHRVQMVPRPNDLEFRIFHK